MANGEGICKVPTYLPPVSHSFQRGNYNFTVEVYGRPYPNQVTKVNIANHGTIAILCLYIRHAERGQHHFCGLPAKNIPSCEEIPGKPKLSDLYKITGLSPLGNVRALEGLRDRKTRW